MSIVNFLLPPADYLSGHIILWIATNFYLKLCVIFVYLCLNDLHFLLVFLYLIGGNNGAIFRIINNLCHIMQKFCMDKIKILLLVFVIKKKCIDFYLSWKLLFQLSKQLQLCLKLLQSLGLLLLWYLEFSSFSSSSVYLPLPLKLNFSIRFLLLFRIVQLRPLLYHPQILFLPHFLGLAALNTLWFLGTKSCFWAPSSYDVSFFIVIEPS